MGGALFLTLESVKFSNQFIRPLFKLEPQNYGVFTIKRNLYKRKLKIIKISLKDRLKTVSNHKIGVIDFL